MTTRRLPCPTGDKGHKDRAYAVTQKPDGALVGYCHRREYRSTEGGKIGNGSVTDRQRLRPVLATSSNVTSLYGLKQWAADIWAECQPIRKGTVAFSYLQARHCAIPPTDGDLRFHPDLKHGPSTMTGPALMALVTDVHNNKPISLHRTRIRSDGNKANLSPPRLLAAKHRKKRGVLRLWPDEAVTTGLGIGEGIESCLTIASYRTPMWSGIDSGNLADFPVLDGIECLSVYADHDPHGKGLGSARAAGQRWHDAAREVHVYLPPDVGADWNDVARNG